LGGRGLLKGKEMPGTCLRGKGRAGKLDRKPTVCLSEKKKIRKEKSLFLWGSVAGKKNGPTRETSRGGDQTGEISWGTAGSGEKGPSRERRVP